MDDLKNSKDDLISSKNEITEDRDAPRQRVDQLESQLQNLQSRYPALEECCHLALSACDDTTRELENIAGKIPSL